MAEKTNLNVVFVGHVDHGKSSAIGRLLYEAGKIPEQTLVKLREEAKKHGKIGFEFAFIMDKCREERERGLTIDLAYKKIVTKNFMITIIDAPGHKDFVKNMITGTSQADAGILTVAASEGVMAQTIEHVHLCITMGVDQIAVLINKMDLVKYDEAKYNKVKEDVTALLKPAGYDPSKINFIAASALKGDNITKKSENMKWYKGPTLLEQFDLFSEPKKPVEVPLRMPIQDVYDIKGIGTVPVGKVETGKMVVGQKVIILPARTGRGISGEVKTIEMHHESLKEAVAGDNIGINIRGVGKKDIERGDVIGPAENPPTVVEEFTARTAILSARGVIAKGYTPVFHVHTAQVPCQFVELVEKLNPKTGEVIQKNPDFLKNGDMAVVKIQPKGNLVIEKQSVNPHMSRFAVRDAGATVAAGVCIDLVEKKIEKKK